MNGKKIVAMESMKVWVKSVSMDPLIKQGLIEFFLLYSSYDTSKEERAERGQINDPW